MTDMDTHTQVDVHCHTSVTHAAKEIKEKDTHHAQRSVRLVKKGGEGRGGEVSGASTHSPSRPRPPKVSQRKRAIDCLVREKDRLRFVSVRFGALCLLCLSVCLSVCGPK
mmetsp:Transcript_20348/g.49497  ORF Transcript_20348/g.49497 Transcript_20348/m.49497 type:complete len:110 (-) Transcript_20348:2-331(-)